MVECRVGAIFPVSASWPSHFFLSGQEKVTKKKATPSSGPALRSGSPRSIAAPGARHEGPSMALAALAASMPLDPFHGDSARPDEGGIGAGPTSAKTGVERKSYSIVPTLSAGAELRHPDLGSHAEAWEPSTAGPETRKNFQAARSGLPFSRPSVGVVEGDARQDAERVTKGHGRPFVRGRLGRAPGAAPKRGNPGRAAAGAG